MPTLPPKVSPVFNPADFVLGIDNPYFPLQPGTTYVYENPGDDAFDTFIVTHRTRVIDGVTCTVVHDVAYEDGEVVEDTLDYHAQDKYGNVWYFGEDTKELEDGKVVSTEGSWRAGVNGAEPGIIMEAHPQLGDTYKQENAPGVAEDTAQIAGFQATADVPYGTFSNLLDTKEFSPLEPDVIEHKLYALGIGVVDGVENTGDFDHLVKIIFDGTSKDDTFSGNIGPDEINGHSGNDTLDGGSGKDIVKGGRGDDVIGGGNDTEADLLAGNQGQDHIDLRTGDKGFGGDNNDTLRLFDIEGFGSVNGGHQDGNRLNNTLGDVLEFEGTLDLTKDGVSERISHIETLSMVGSGHDELTLGVQDVLDLGEGKLNPAFAGKDSWGRGDAARVEGGDGDQLTLTGGNWQELTGISNVPADHDVFARQTSTGTAYVVVNDQVEVHLT